MKFRLPEKAKVHIVVPDVEVPSTAYAGSPRLLYPEQAVDFKKDAEVLSPSSPGEDGREGSGNQRSARPTLKELLLADTPRAEIPVPLRRHRKNLGALSPAPESPATPRSRPR
jgi:hypothetical protein